MKTYKNFLLSEVININGDAPYNKKSATRDILIVNIQPAYENRIKFKMEEFTRWMSHFKPNGVNKIHYFYNGEKIEDDIVNMPKWFEEKGLVEGIYVEPYNIAQIHEYFDDLLKTNYNHDDFITVIKFLIKNNYDEVRDSNPEELDKLMINEKFKEELIEGKHKIFVPYDLIDKLKEMHQPYIVGGLKHSAMEIIRILFESINKEYLITDKWIF